jgi:hypothetical protein
MSRLAAAMGALAAAALTLGWSLPFGPKPPAVRFVVREQSLGKADHIWGHTLSVSADGKHLAYAQKSGRGAVMVVDGKRSREYARVWDLAMAPKGGRVAYCAQRDWDPRVIAGIRWFPKAPASGPRPSVVPETEAPARPACFVVVNGREGAPYDAVNRPVFSPDGTRLAYLARSKDRRQRIVVDGLEAAELGRLDCDPVVVFDGPASCSTVFWRRDEVVRVAVDIIEPPPGPAP